MEIKMKTILLILVLNLSLLAQGKFITLFASDEWQPSDVTSASLYAEYDWREGVTKDVNNKVTQFNDLINGLNFVQADTSKSPDWSLADGLTFNDDTDVMLSASANIFDTLYTHNTFSIFTLYSTTETRENRQIIGIEGAYGLISGLIGSIDMGWFITGAATGRLRDTIGVSNDGNFRTTTVTFDGSIQYMYGNGVFCQSASKTEYNLGAVSRVTGLGAAYNETAHTVCKVKIILVYLGVVSEADRIKIEAYLAGLK